MKKLSVSTLFKLIAAVGLLFFLFPAKTNAATCKVRSNLNKVIIDINDLPDPGPTNHKVTVFTDTCKTFNAKHGYQKSFCNEVEPRPPGSTSTKATISNASVFHSGHYDVYVHEKFAGDRCFPETTVPFIAKCEFEISVADGAQKCGPGDCGATQDMRACPEGQPGMTVEKCCSVDDTLRNCSRGYKPLLYLDFAEGSGLTTCFCRCDEDFAAQYEPCRSIKKQCENIDEECDKITDAEKKTECQNKLTDCQDEYNDCLACTAPPDPKEPGVWTALGCVAVQPAEFIATLVRIGFGIGGGLAFLFMIMGALKILTSEGNPETINAGRQMIVNALSGLVLIIFSIIILKILGYDILGLPGFGNP